MTVAHLTFNMNYGGTEKVIEHLMKHGDTATFNQMVICLDHPIGPLGIKLRESGAPIAGFNRRPGLDIRLISHLRDFIRQHRIDILHCHQYSPYVYGALASRGTTAKVIYTEHGRFYPDRRRLKRVVINPLLSRMTHAFTAISHATVEALVKYENLPRHRVEVIYNGIHANGLTNRSTPLERAYGLPPQAFVLGTVARLDPIKNHRLMIQATHALSRSDPDIFLLIVGDGPERENLTNLVRDLDLEQRVIITGWHEHPAELYKQMDVFLLTSFSEGTAMTLLEAMAAGLPSIVTAVGGNPEIVEHGRTGFVVPSDDKLAVVERIRELKSNPTLKSTMGDQARQCFEKKFTVERMTAAYRELYDRITADGRN